MKKIFPILTLTSAWLLGAAPASANEAAAQYIQSLTSFLPQLKNKAAAIWPGFQIEAKPLIVAENGGGQEGQQGDSLYALDATLQNPAWQKQIINDTPVYYMQHDTIGAHDYRPSMLKPYFALENQLATVFDFYDDDNDPAETTYRNNQLLAMDYYAFYEFLHSPYAESKWQILKQENIVHDGFNKAENVALLFLEASVLKNYLETHNEEALKDYAALFQYRYQLIDKNSQIYEVTAGEPIADDYVAIKAVAQNDADFAAQVLRDYANVRLPLPEYASLLTDYYDDTLRFTHLAVEHGLDKVQPTWKDAVESSNTPPSILLQQHYHFSDKEVAARVQLAKTNYGYAAISQSISASLTPYLQEMQALQAEYQQNAGVEFVMNLPKDYNIRSEDNTPLNQYVLDSEVTLTRATAKLLAYDHNGKLNFDGKNVPAFYMITKDSLTDAATIDTAIKFKLPNNAKLHVDGKADTLAHFVATDKQLEFHQLTIEAAGQEQQALSITLDVKAAGYELAVANGKLQILLPKNKSKAVTMLPSRHVRKVHALK